MTKLTLKEAVQKFVGDFNHIPQELIKKAYPNWYDELSFLSTVKECAECGCTEFFAEGGENEGDEDIHTCSSCGCTDFHNRHDMPMWGTFFNPKDTVDAHWIRENLDVMEELGIWVIDEEECGILLGMDSAGHDFYEAYWTPLYKARGLKWHDEEYEFLQNMNWVNGFERDNEEHIKIAKEIFNSVQDIELEEYEERTTGGEAWTDANLHSLVESFLYNGFKMEHANGADVLYMYCEEAEQYVMSVQ